MPTGDKDKETSSFPATDPDLDQGNLEDLKNFDEPIPSPWSARPGSSARRPNSSLENGLGSFFKGLNEVANFITELAEKTEQAAQRAAEKRAVNNEYKPQNGVTGFAAKWGIGPNPNQERPGGPPLSPFSRPPAPYSSNSVSTADPAATVREPFLEVHDETEQGQILVIAELPGVDEAHLQIEIQDDVLIIRGEGATFRYEKETLLPAIVQPEPHSRQFQNGLLELRLKKI